ncbi:MAG: Fur family transcriptional regulator [Actinomycetota bacterium]
MDLATVLRQADFRVTRPRQLVWEVLHDSHAHLSALEIADEVRSLDPTVNTSSVYRTLSLFADLHLVRESRLVDDDSVRWEPIHDDAVIHLVCESCREVLHHDVEVVDELRARLEREAGFLARSVEVVVRGVCGRCTSATR